MEGLDTKLSARSEQKEEAEKFNDLIIFTTTFYKNDESSRVRSALAEEFFDHVNRLNIKCVVVDGGSYPEFLENIQKFKNVQIIPGPTLGMGESRREALSIALNSMSGEKNPSFLWVEPEKEDLIKEKSLESMIELLREKKADIVVPSRISKESYPKFQKWIEERANKRAGELFINRPGSEDDELFDSEVDLWFGPKMFNKEGAKFFLDYKGDLDKWDSIIKPVIEAQNAGKNIVSVPVDFRYPEKQRKYEEGNRVFDQKRIDQYKQILTELGDPHWKNKAK